MNKRKYRQLTAADITERWKLIAELSSQTEELRRRQKELGEATANLQLISRERETQAAKMRARDVLGERLIYMLRLVRSEQEPDYATLRGMAGGLMDELMAVQGTLSFEQRLGTLRDTFRSIRVEIVVSGMPPEDKERAGLFMDIIRESVTNAVRHGFATKVNVALPAVPGGCSMVISDNGQPPAGQITEGGGLSGIREKVRAFGGDVTVSVSPRFILTVNLPGGEDDD